MNRSAMEEKPTGTNRQGLVDVIPRRFSSVQVLPNAQLV